MNYVRTVSVAHDGQRWQFSAHGVQQDFEDESSYRSRRVRDRFTSAMLQDYCDALGIECFNPDFYGPRAVLVESTVPLAPGATQMSLREVQAWLEIVPGAADDLPG
jgi:hypothetical protein